MEFHKKKKGGAAAAQERHHYQVRLEKTKIIVFSYIHGHT